MKKQNSLKILIDPFLERANSGDLEGVVALYDPNAVLSFPAGQTTIGRENIRAVYERLLEAKTKFQGEVRPALRNGDLALTSTRFPGDATTEVARRNRMGPGSGSSISRVC